MSRCAGGRLLLTAMACGFALLAHLSTGCAIAPVTKADDVDPRCACEFRSWVVAWRGRHLYLKIDCPAPNEALSGVVEFTSESFRDDYEAPADPIATPPRVARMTPGHRLRPARGEPDNRLESTFAITPAQAVCLQRDRTFKATYVLLGPNSNSGLRTVCQACGVSLPERLLRQGGLLGEFPGINHDVGREVVRMAKEIKRSTRK